MIRRSVCRRHPWLRPLVLGSVLSLFGTVIPATAASAATRQPLATLQNPDVSARGFGNTVAVSGSTMVVGSDSPTGAVFIYTKGTSGWPTTPTVTLQDPDVSGGDYFGWRVAVSGTTIVVGAFEAHGGSGEGAVYIYTKGTSGWPTTPTVTLEDPDATAGDRFGGNVAVSGATIVVEPGTAEPGDAYVYTRTKSGWPTTPTVTLHDPDTASGDYFLGGVTVSGATIVLSAVVNSRRGIVFVYTKGSAGWPTTPTVTLRDPGKLTSDAFASAVAVSGTTIVVDAFGAESKRGVVYVYVDGAAAWPTTPTVTLQNPDAVPPSKGPGDFFGSGGHLAISGTTITIGAYDTRKSRGAAYVYKEGSTGWPSGPTISIHDPAAGAIDAFGSAVAVSGPTVVVGDPNADNTVGVTYVYAA